MKVWLNDGLVEDHEARVSVFDHGFTVADGVFETLKVSDGAAFAVSRHLRRLGNSARTLGLPDPDEDLIRSAVVATLSANASSVGDLARLRITYTAGAGPLGSDRVDAAPTLVVAMTAMAPWPDSAAVVTVEWVRNDRGPLVGVKSTSYADNVLALAEARRQGASEAIMADTQGRLCEGTGSNVLVVLDGQAITPTLATGALPGITRELMLEWGQVSERDVPMTVLAQAEEIWLMSSTRDLQAVNRLDGHQIPSPGPVGGALRRIFLERSARDIDP